MEKLARSRRSMQHVATSRNTPRTIRSRLSFPRRKLASDTAAVPEAPVQQVVRSPSGKMALGPWLGSFGGLEQGGMGLLAEDPPSPTLFATSQGRVFSDLRGAPVEASDLVSEPEAVPAHAMVHKDGSMTLAAREQVLAVKQGQRRLAAPRERLPRTPPANIAMRRQRRVMQARKFNSVCLQASNLRKVAAAAQRSANQ